jgi:hypothetical protein
VFGVEVQGRRLHARCRESTDAGRGRVIGSGAGRGKIRSGGVRDVDPVAGQ